MPFLAKDLYEGCLLASIAHAVMAAQYPLLSYEQSWDGPNYSLVDESGQRGTVSFVGRYCVAAFRNERSERLRGSRAALHYFAGAPEEAIEIARATTLQYLLTETADGVKPTITSAFWGCRELHSIDCVDALFRNGVELLERQTMRLDAAVESWREYYEMSEDEVALTLALFEKKREKPDAPLVFDGQVPEAITAFYDEGIAERKAKLRELSIIWP